jgi:glycosyltransferase involved in cell wall biosynthesis
MRNVHANFTWPAMVAKYQECFVRLVGEKRALVAHVTPYFPPHLGGMENVVQEIASQLVVHDHQVRVITSDLGYSDGFIDMPELRGVVERLQSTEVARLPILWNLLPRLLALPKHSVLHVHVAQAFLPELALLCAKLRGSKCIAHFHLDVDGSGGTFSFIFAAYKKVLFPWTLRGADRVIVFSDEQQDLVTTKYGVRREKVVVIPNGVAVSDAAWPRTYKQDGKQLLYVGRLSAQKRVDRLIGAMQYLPADVHLHIVGDGDKLAELRAQVSSCNLDTVTFHGALFGAALRSMYQKADMFVMASEHEGMPLVILEAMAEGLPVCASNVVGTRELVRGYGVLVDDLTPQAFAAEIKWNLPAERLNKLSAASIRNAKKYSWQSIITRIGALYSEVSR